MHQSFLSNIQCEFEIAVLEIINLYACFNNIVQH